MVFINLLCTLLSWFNVNFGTLKKCFTNTLPNQRITWQLHCNHEFSCSENLFCSVEFTENINKIFSTERSHSNLHYFATYKNVKLHKNCLTVLEISGSKLLNSKPTIKHSPKPSPIFTTHFAIWDSHQRQPPISSSVSAKWIFF